MKELGDTTNEQIETDPNNETHEQKGLGSSGRLGPNEDSRGVRMRRSIQNLFGSQRKMASTSVDENSTQKPHAEDQHCETKSHFDVMSTTKKSVSTTVNKLSSTPRVLVGFPLTVCSISLRKITDRLRGGQEKMILGGHANLISRK